MFYRTSSIKTSVKTYDVLIFEVFLRIRIGDSYPKFTLLAAV